MNREQIKERIVSICCGAWLYSSKARYILEQLPKSMNSHYNELVSAAVDRMIYYISDRDLKYYCTEIDILVTHYYKNQEEYDEFN